MIVWMKYGLTTYWLKEQKEKYVLEKHGKSLNQEGRKFLFNDALNTFYLRLYGIRYIVKDHSDSERGNPLLPHGLLFPISCKGYFIYASSHRQDDTYHKLCYTSRGAP